MSIREPLMLCTAALLYYSGLMQVINWLHRSSRPRLLILNYHQASGGNLRRHLLYLQKYFHLQSLEQAAEELYNAQVTPASKRKRLAVAVTFDDGYLDNYTEAFELADKLHIPLTFFLVTDYVGKDTAFWWFDHLVEKSRKPQVTLDERVFDLSQPHDQLALACLIATQIKRLTTKEEQLAYLKKIGALLSLPEAELADLDGTSVALFNWEQARQMQASGYITFGGHTAHHLTLSHLDSVDKAYQEVAQGQADLREHLNTSACIFAYPHGRLNHIGLNGILAVQQAGYRWAVTTHHGSNTPTTHPYLLKRIPVNSQFHWLKIALMTSGAWDLLAFLRWHLITAREYRDILPKMLAAVSYRSSQPAESLSSSRK
jgi:peptidoglycan/xylan/chitin deacetylase (PgdA/CDA1 family)